MLPKYSSYVAYLALLRICNTYWYSNISIHSLCIMIQYCVIRYQCITHDYFKSHALWGDADGSKDNGALWGDADGSKDNGALWSDTDGSKANGAGKEAEMKNLDSTLTVSGTS